MKARIIFCIFVCALLTGCMNAQLGNKKIEDVGRYMSLQKGKSEKTDVYISFGQPHEVVYGKPDPDTSYWEYYTANVQMSGVNYVPFIGLIFGGMNTNASTSTIYFDKNGKFTRLETKSNSKYVNQWAGMAKGADRSQNDTKPDRVKPEMEKLGLPYDPVIAKGVEDITILTED